MEKELKACTGVLLRADLPGHGHPTCFGRKGLYGHALLARSALKRTPVQDFYYFPIMFYYISTICQKIGDLFCLDDISGLSHSVICSLLSNTQAIWKQNGSKLQF